MVRFQVTRFVRGQSSIPALSTWHFSVPAPVLFPIASQATFISTAAIFRPAVLSSSIPIPTIQAFCLTPHQFPASAPMANWLPLNLRTQNSFHEIPIVVLTSSSEISAAIRLNLFQLATPPCPQTL